MKYIKYGRYTLSMGQALAGDKFYLMAAAKNDFVVYMVACPIESVDPQFLRLLKYLDSRKD